MHLGVSKNGGTPKWTVIILENPIMDDLGVPLFLETPISVFSFFLKKIWFHWCVLQGLNLKCVLLIFVVFFFYFAFRVYFWYVVLCVFSLVFEYLCSEVFFLTHLFVSWWKWLAVNLQRGTLKNGPWRFAESEPVKVFFKSHRSGIMEHVVFFGLCQTQRWSITGVSSQTCIQMLHVWNIYLHLP